MIAVPIKDEIMLGVLQLINFEGDPNFDSSDLKRAAFLARCSRVSFASRFRVMVARSINWLNRGV
jgi:hypothetical protein